MALNQPNTNGQAASANSSPVVIASDQSAIAIKGTATTTSTAAWTSATPTATTLTVATSGYASVAVTVSNTSTMTAGVITFEISPDNVVWVGTLTTRVDAYLAEPGTYNLTNIAARAWTVSTNGFAYFRVRLSTAIVGTGTASLTITPQIFPVQPVVTVGQGVAANMQVTATQAGGWTVTPANTANTTAWLMRLSAQGTGGATMFTLLSAATTNATSIKITAGTLFSLNASNTTATIAYIKLYNKASAPTVGTDTPVMTITVPANGYVDLSIPPMGLAFATGIAYAITGAAALADATAVAANQIILNGSYA